MAYTPGFEYDVFLSYSQANNSEKWVTRFEEKLAARLRELSSEIKIFRDSQSLQGNHELTPELQRAVKSSAVFVPVVSKSYIQRPWCLQECQSFLEANPNRGSSGRIFPVRYDNLSPAEYQKLLGGDFLGYQFFGTIEEGNAAKEFATESNDFDNKMLVLRDHIHKQLQQLERARQSAHAPAVANGARPAAQGDTARGQRPIVLVAESPPALAARRDELIAFLEGSQIDVLQPGPDFHKLEGYEARFDELLGRADLFVQLLGRSFVAHADDDLQSWDRWQHQRAVAAKTPLQRWFNKFDKEGRELDVSQLDAVHREFVTLAGTWDCDFQKFKQIVDDDAQRRGNDRRQRERAAETGTKPHIVIRSDKSDRQFAEGLMPALKQLNCESERVPDKDMQSLEEYARGNPANGLLIVYRACPGDWVKKQIQEVRKFLTTDLGRRWATYGLLKDPLDDDPPSWSFDWLLVVDPPHEQALQKFVASLGNLGRTEVTQ